ncbi:MAG: hypothetical protein R3C19_20035 [Planctomycetaceae bacterium]
MPNVARGIAIALLLASFSGCSLFVMAGKAILGDPQVSSEFRLHTGIDLTDGDDSVLILCTAPHGIVGQFPSLQIDIVDRMTRTLKTRKVKVIPSDDVATWFDDHGEWGDFSELAKKFDAKYVMHVNVQAFTYKVPDSETLLQGSSHGRVLVYAASSDDDAEVPIRQVFDRSFKIHFPTSYPVPRENESDEIFVERFMDRVALHIAQIFYDHPFSENIH